MGVQRSSNKLLVCVVCGLSLLAYCGERMGCITKKPKPPPQRLDRGLLTEKLAELIKQQTGFSNLDDIWFSTDDWNVTIRRSREDSPARHVSIHVRSEVTIAAQDFSPTGSVIELCSVHVPQWDNQEMEQQDIAKTYEIKDGPLVGDVLVLRWSKNTPLAHP